ALIFAVLSILPLLGLAFGRISKSVAPTAAQGRAAGGDVGLTLFQALREWRFWVLAFAFVPISFALGGPIPNIELLLGAKSFGAAEAVGLAALVGVAVIVGRIVGGYLIDRFWAPGVAAIFLSAPAIALWFLGAPEMTRDMAMISIFLIGFGAGVEYDFMAYLVARYFGTRAYGAIYGSLYGFFAIGAGFGPPMFAAAVRSGPAAVESLMHAAMGVLIVGSVALLTLGRYRTFEAEPIAAEPANTRAETIEDVRPA
ncbi:MAG: MFS transporter, partial [Caulobacterales bacterium]